MAGGSNSRSATSWPVAIPTSSTSPKPLPRCEPGTSIFYAASNYVVDIAQDDTWLYAQTEEEVVRVSKDGSGLVQSLVRERPNSKFQGLHRIAAYQGVLYWARGGDGSIWRVRLGKEPELFVVGAIGTGEATSLLVVNDLLYFKRDNRVNVVDLADDGDRELEQARSFVADTDGYYFVRDRDESSNELLLGGANLNGDGHWETRLPPDAAQASLFVDGNFIYYLADSVDYSALRRREKFGERDELVSSSEFLDDEASLVVDGNDVFWASEGSLYHVRIGKGTTPELANRQFRYDADDYAGFILIDADYVYWQANVDGVQHDDDDPLPIVRTCRAGLSQ